MRQRKYSIDEIDSMRAAVKRMFPFSHSPSSAQVEDRLRTHMLNGTDPDELDRVSKERAEANLAEWRESQRIANEQRKAIARTFAKGRAI